MKKERKIILSAIIVEIILMIFIGISNAAESSQSANYISLNDNNITINGESITKDASKDVYLTTSMNNGGNSSDAENVNIEITNIININKSGTYEITGSLSDGQISINSNNINGDIIIILNNASITCENAPAIFVYNKQTNSTNCNITIKTANNSNNTISGGKIKQSVEGWSDQSEILYYVEKGYDDDRQYYERYKYDGAISSDISLTFEGEGTLTVNALAKEGIESKRDITINSGNYIINSLDDGINASTDNESVITINGGTILVNVTDEAEEGDGIDSNGYIYINGGTIYAFASEKSQDSGLDSDCGIYINGGTVVGTGNMADSISNDSKQEFMQLQFKTKVSKDTLITITDESKNPIVAFKSDRSYSILTISTPDFTEGNHYVYEGGSIEGTSQNGLYTKITSYTEGTEKEYTEGSNMEGPTGFDKSMDDMKNINENRDNKIYCCTIIVLVTALVILIIFAIVLKKKGKIVTLFIGILVGAIITTTGLMIYSNITANKNSEMMNDRPGQMSNDSQMPSGNGIPNNGQMPNDKTNQ